MYIHIYIYMERGILIGGALYDATQRVELCLGEVCYSK